MKRPDLKEQLRVSMEKLLLADFPEDIHTEKGRLLRRAFCIGVLLMAEDDRFCCERARGMQKEAVVIPLAVAAVRSMEGMFYYLNLSLPGMN